MATLCTHDRGPKKQEQDKKNKKQPKTKTNSKDKKISITGPHKEYR